MTIATHLFRAYDIRGVAFDDLTEQAVEAIGQAFAREMLARGQHTVSVARDGRHSGPALLAALKRGLSKAGVHVCDVGAVPTPLLYYASCELSGGTGVMVTGSHNPSDYNGLKMMIGGETLADTAITALYHRIVRGELVTATGGKESVIDVIDRYCARVCRDVSCPRALRVVVDCGSGIAGAVAPQLLTALGMQVIPLYCEVDGDFPHHHPDPSKPENLRDLKAAVLAEKADMGLAFDGDGDRLGVVTEQAEIIWPDRLLMLFACDLLQRQPSASVIYDVKCSKWLHTVIEQHGGEAVMCRTGHAPIKQQLAKQARCQLAGEMSGHFFFKENWYGFDDALYAAARLLAIVSQQTVALSQLMSPFPESISTPELQIALSDQKKFGFVERFIEQSRWPDDAQCITLDGLRVELADGWGLLRASNTTPCLVLRFEADTPAALTRIKALFKQQIERVDSDVSVAVLHSNSY